MCRKKRLQRDLQPGTAGEELEGISFPGKMTKEQSVEMTGRLMNGVKESGAFSGSRSRYLYLDRIPDLERTALLERRAISRGVSKKKAAAGWSYLRMSGWGSP